jgi:hypothetical protein
MEPERQYIFDKPDNVRRVLRILYLLCALLLAADLVIHRHALHSWEPLWGFYAWYGFGACVALVLLAKQLRRAVRRPENYYDNPPAFSAGGGEAAQGTDAISSVQGKEQDRV